MCMIRGEGLAHRVPPPPSIWKPPVGEFIKFNVDGALSVTNVGGLGLVARESRGKLLGAKMESMNGIFSARIIEALGFRCALQTALDWNYSHIIVEGDALQVV